MYALTLYRPEHSDVINANDNCWLRDFDQLGQVGSKHITIHPPAFATIRKMADSQHVLRFQGAWYGERHAPDMQPHSKLRKCGL